MQSAGVPILSRIPAASVLFSLFCVVVFAYILSYAWVTEDAYITFRVVDNVVHGYGLRWNVDERVQVYTHPLWMLIHIPFYALWGNIYLTTIAISTVLVVATLWVCAHYKPVSRVYIAVLLLLPLACSPTFCHYSISGLEIPLSLFWLALFCKHFLESPRRIYRLCFIASCAMLTRLDNGVMLFPFMVWAVGTQLRQLRWRRVLLATLPLSIWSVFSLFYYGFVFPNTKYAKLDTGIAQAEYYQQGLHYLEYWMHMDFFAFMWVGIACIGAGVTVIRKTEGAANGNEIIFYGLSFIGITLHIAYVIAVGGDFMVGRFLIAPFFLSVLVIYCLMVRVKQAPLIAGIAGIIGMFAQQTMQSTVAEYRAGGYYGIVDEWSNFYENHLLASSWIRTEPDDRMAGIGKKAEHDHWVVDNHYTVVYGIIGMYGYYAGPRVTIIDPMALTDPLLARLPVHNQQLERIGHFRRDVPTGYDTARRTGDFSAMEPQLADYYQKLHLVTSGALFDWERIKTIVGFQLGWYDEERNSYLAHHPL